MIEQELGNLLPFEVPFATMLTMVEVDRGRSRLRESDQVHRPGLCRSRSRAARRPRRAGSSSRTATSGAASSPSPQPKQIFEIRPIQWLLEKGTVVIARRRRRHSDRLRARTRNCAASRRSSTRISAPSCWRASSRPTVFIMATDADAVFVDWGKPTAKAFRRATRPRMRAYSFPAGSMGPKVDAACHFAEATGKARGDRGAEGPAAIAARRGGDHDHQGGDGESHGRVKGHLCVTDPALGEGRHVRLKLRKSPVFAFAVAIAPATAHAADLPSPITFDPPARSAPSSSAAARTVMAMRSLALATRQTKGCSAPARVQGFSF